MREETFLQFKRRKVRYAVQLRRRMTPAETILWNALRRKACKGLKFRRQVPISWFIVDFLCVHHCLVVEVDGGVHAERAAYDEEREAALRARGYKILRFSNEQVLRDLPVVLRSIEDSCKK